MVEISSRTFSLLGISVAWVVPPGACDACAGACPSLSGCLEEERGPGCSHRWASDRGTVQRRDPGRTGRLQDQQPVACGRPHVWAGPRREPGGSRANGLPFGFPSYRGKQRGGVRSGIGLGCRQSACRRPLSCAACACLPRLFLAGEGRRLPSGKPIEDSAARVVWLPGWFCCCSRRGWLGQVGGESEDVAS